MALEWIYNQDKKALYNIRSGVVIYVSDDGEGRYGVVIDSLHLPEDKMAGLLGREHTSEASAVAELEFIIESLGPDEMLYLGGE